MPDLESLIVGNEIIHARARGIGVLSPEMITAYGVSGPIAAPRGLTWICAAMSRTWPTESSSPMVARVE